MRWFLPVRGPRRSVFSVSHACTARQAGSIDGELASVAPEISDEPSDPHRGQWTEGNLKRFDIYADLLGGVSGGS